MLLSGAGAHNSECAIPLRWNVLSYATVRWLFGGSTNGSLFLLQLLPNAHVRSVLVFYDMAFTCGGFHLRVLLIGVGCGALRR